MRTWPQSRVLRTAGMQYTLDLGLSLSRSSAMTPHPAVNDLLDPAGTVPLK